MSDNAGRRRIIGATAAVLYVIAWCAGFAVVGAATLNDSHVFTFAFPTLVVSGFLAVWLENIEISLRAESPQ